MYLCICLTFRYTLAYDCMCIQKTSKPTKTKKKTKTKQKYATNAYSKKRGITAKDTQTPKHTHTLSHTHHPLTHTLTETLRTPPPSHLSTSLPFCLSECY